MRKLFALGTSVLAWVLSFGGIEQRSASQLYSKPTYAQVMELIAAVKGEPTDRGPWNDGSVPASYLYSTPTYAQVDALIQAVKESGGGDTNSVTCEAFIAATNLLTQIKVGTNDFIAATNELRGEISVLNARLEKQKYLRVIDFYDTFDADADWYDDWADEHGYCTSMRYGNVYVRNYDWKYTEAMTYVGRLPSAEGRYASVFVCNVGTNLTPGIEATGAWTRFHRALPGRAVDGINEKGVVCNINVVPMNGSAWETGGGARDLSLTRACRYVLDHFDNAKDAAEYVAAHGYVPESLKRQGFSLHMMIADARDTYIVEDGLTQRTDPTGSVTPMTNFRVVNTSVEDPYGSGKARYDVMQRAATTADPENEIASAIQSVWYTHAYVKNDDGNYPWPDEFAGTVVVTNAAGHVVGTVPKETGSPWEHKLRNDEDDLLQETCKFVIPDYPHERWQRNGLSWQTIHCSVYDISNRCLRVAVQENPSWFIVSVPTAGGAAPTAVDALDRVLSVPSKNEFDVWANSTTEIPEGKISEMPDDVKSLLVSVYGEGVLDLTLSTVIPTQMTHKVIFRTETPFADLGTIDIRIDWGDGTETRGSDVVWEQGVNCSVAAEDDVYIVFIHTYAKDGRYTVSVYGDDYFNMRHQMNRSDLKIQDSTYNLVCGVALHDGAVNPLKTNASAMWMNSIRLLSVNAAGRFRHYTNISTLFNGCANLNEFSGELGDRVRSAPQVFQACYALRTVNGFTIPVDRLISFQAMFDSCYDAAIDLSQLIIRPFTADAVTMTTAFRYCRKATGTVPAKFLWEDTGVKWTTGSQSMNWARNVGMWWQPGDIINHSSRTFLCTNGYIVATDTKSPPSDAAHWVQVDNAYSKFAVNQSGPFAGSSAEVRAQVPVAWGGSNTNIVIPAYTGRKSYATADDLAAVTNAFFSFNLRFATNEVTSATYIAATNILKTLGFDSDTIDSIPGGTVYGSLGALLVALAAGLVLTRKKTAHLESDGTADDDFAASLLEKPGANVKANTTAIAPAFSDGSTYAVGDTVTHEGNLYTCKTEISTAGAWDSAKWDSTPVNALIDAKIGDVNAVLAAALDGSEVA